MGYVFMGGSEIKQGQGGERIYPINLYEIFIAKKM